MHKRLLQLAFVFLLAITTIGAGDTGSRFNNIGHKMVCTCGCGQILLECNHVGCPNSSGMIDELRTQLASGATDTSVFNAFMAKYGPTVLAAPIRGGFDNAAFIVPAVVFFLALVGTAFLIKHWSARHPATAGAPAIPTSQQTTMRDRIRRDTDF